MRSFLTLILTNEDEWVNLRQSSDEEELVNSTDLFKPTYYQQQVKTKERPKRLTKPPKQLIYSKRTPCEALKHAIYTGLIDFNLFKRWDLFYLF